jgi:hypothetical protein
MRTYRSANGDALVVVLPRLDDAAVAPLHCKDLNDLFEQEQPTFLLLTRDGATDAVEAANDS